MSRGKNAHELLTFMTTHLGTPNQRPVQPMVSVGKEAAVMRADDDSSRSPRIADNLPKKPAAVGGFRGDIKLIDHPF